MAARNLRARKDKPETEAGKPLPKNERIVALFLSGMTGIRDIATLVEARPSYVAQVLGREGLVKGYFDLYTPTGVEQNVYSRDFENVLAFRDVQAAKSSVEQIDRLYRRYEAMGDRAGQHQAMVLALVGQNRARWSGKLEEASIFHDWLITH